MKRRWPVVVLAAVLLLLSVAVVVTLLSARSLEGAVPGKAPLLGLAVASGRYYAASETGLFVSVDGRTWSKPRMFDGRPALVTAAGPRHAVILSGRQLFRAGDSGRYVPVLPGPAKGQAIAFSGANVYIARDPQTVLMVSATCLTADDPPVQCTGPDSTTSLRLKGGPPEILALDAVPSEPPLLFAGGLRSGVWRSPRPERQWRRVLETATRAILADDGDNKRIYIGTAGGLLVSRDQGLSWSFTGLRQPVEALAQSDGTLFALASNRLVYHSSDGQVWQLAASTQGSAPK